MWYYNLDNQQKGPVSEEELQKMLQEHLPKSTLIWKEGMAEWANASELFQSHSSESHHESSPVSVDPELPQNPYAAPSSVVHESPISNGAIEIPEQPIPLDISFCVKQGWKFTCRNFGKIFLFGLVYLVLSGVIGGVFTSIGSAIDGPQASATPPVEEANYEGMDSSEIFVQAFNAEYQKEVGPVQNLMAILSQIAQTFFSLGAIAFGLSLIRGQDANIGQLFSQSPKKFISYLIASLLYGIMVGIGFIFLIFPGIYLSIRFGLYQFAIVDKNLGPLEALKYSSQLTRDNKLNLFLLGILSFLIIVAGMLALGVGLLWAIPTAWLASVIAYCYLHGAEASIDTQH